MRANLLQRLLAKLGLISFMAEAAPAPAPAAPAPAPAVDAPAPAPAAPAPAPAAPAPTPAPSPAPTPAPAPAADAKPKEGDKPPGAPEQYAEFKLPEGMRPDPQTVQQFTPVFKELGLPQEAAQRLVTVQAEAALRQVNAWREAAMADKEYGGEKFDENRAVALRAVERFGTPEFSAWLDRTGMGYHPELIRVLFRAGKAISDDGFVPGRQGGAAPTLAERMYPGMNP